MDIELVVVGLMAEFTKKPGQVLLLHTHTLIQTHRWPSGVPVRFVLVVSYLFARSVAADWLLDNDSLNWLTMQMLLSYSFCLFA